jgi:hypothetical protein
MAKALSLLLAAAVALTAAPATAKTSKHAKHKQARIVHVARQAAQKYWGTDKFPAGPLYYNGGTYMGDDPDPFIRSQIWRDVSGRFGGEN